VLLPLTARIPAGGFILVIRTGHGRLDGGPHGIALLLPGGTLTVSFQVLISQGSSGTGVPPPGGWRSSTWKRTRWMCIGCIRLLGFSNCQISVVPSCGSSVTSSQSSPITTSWFVISGSNERASHSKPHGVPGSLTRSRLKRRVMMASASGIGSTVRSVAEIGPVKPVWALRGEDAQLEKQPNGGDVDIDALTRRMSNP
jgi:hypothetical protein